ncbi:uncharacterized protein LOC112082108 [Eutrema salsugineum]|uniref:uncharacterized protein LOC112082108 n=1 Tax=Eutrema salsugineum TaxID=72664 RepID=UPI000CED388F|nr:uncharacterized protein LOC112082108 [Eutrema salsugineum]
MRSFEGIVGVFDDFWRMSGLRISVEKSTIYLAGFSDSSRESISQRFAFEFGTLLVRGRVSSWTDFALSFVGRLQLLSSVIASITNFWFSAFQLPSCCVAEIERICSTFLWSGPDLNRRKTKIAWMDVCKPWDEGVLGLKSIWEEDDVCILKLVWRLITANSLWVCWTKGNLMRPVSRTTPDPTNNSLGSWMWKQVLRSRLQAAKFLKVEIMNGRSTLFWHDNWSPMGKLLSFIGARGLVDMGIRKESRVEEVFLSHRRRRHRIATLNAVEEAIDNAKIQYRANAEDSFFWRTKEATYNPDFDTKAT